MALHPIACLFFAIGFVLRELAAFDYGWLGSRLGVFIGSSMFLYAAP